MSPLSPLCPYISTSLPTAPSSRPARQYRTVHCSLLLAWECSFSTDDKIVCIIQLLPPSPAHGSSCPSPRQWGPWSPLCSGTAASSRSAYPWCTTITSIWKGYLICCFYDLCIHSVVVFHIQRRGQWWVLFMLYWINLSLLCPLPKRLSLLIALNWLTLHEHQRNIVKLRHVLRTKQSCPVIGRQIISLPPDSPAQSWSHMTTGLVCTLDKFMCDIVSWANTSVLQNLTFQSTLGWG